MEQIKEKCANAAVNVEHQVGGLGQGVGLHAQRVVQVAHCREEAPRIPLQQLHSLVPVVLGRTCSNTGLGVSILLQRCMLVSLVRTADTHEKTEYSGSLSRL